MKIYADTNFFTYIYLEEPSENKADSRLGVLSNPLPITWLLQAELINAFQLSILSGYGEDRRRISPEMAAACQEQFRDDLRVGTVFESVTLAQANWLRQFKALSLRHASKHGFRTYDLLHVSAALLLGCEAFWSFDKKACKLAKLEGLRTL